MRAFANLVKNWRYLLMSKVTLKGNPVQISGSFPALHTKAPDFQLVDKDLHNRSLKDYAGKKKMLSIVPSLDTPTCSLSTKKFNEQVQNHPEIVVLAISVDTPFAQKRFCSMENISNVIPLSMIRDKRFAEAYGVLIKEGPLAGFCTRAVMILDKNDQVIYTELVSEITHEPNYDKALAVLLKN